jgi:uncharacterized protein (TIGR03118 family)
VVSRWFRSWLRLRRPPGSQRTQRRPALLLEQLDDRCLLSAGFLQTNLVSDVPGLAAFTDPNLINPWGIALDSAGNVRISVNQSGASTFYQPGSQPSPQGGLLAVQVPAAGASSAASGAPTGAVLNSTSGFDISAYGRTAPSQFLFASADGTISGWNPAVDPSDTIVAVDNSSWTPLTGAVYTGLTLGENASGAFLYVANFRSGTVDVFDRNFQPTALSGSFTDPSMPAGFAPFDIQNIGGKLFVTYAKQDANKYGEIAGQGNGYIDVFDTEGHLLERLASQGPLNSPWGLALAPAQFGAFSNDLLVGNLGDGRVNAYDPHSGAFLGPLRDENGNAIAIAGLWGLKFGNGTAAAPANTLYFTAGGTNEDHGLFGTLLAVPAVSAQGNGAKSAGTVASFAESQASGADQYPLPPAKGPAPVAEFIIQPVPLSVLLPLREPLNVASLPYSGSSEASRSLSATESSAGLVFTSVSGTGAGSAALPSLVSSTDANNVRLSEANSAPTVDSFFAQSRPSALSLVLALNDDADLTQLLLNERSEDDGQLPLLTATSDDQASPLFARIATADTQAAVTSANLRSQHKTPIEQAACNQVCSEGGGLANQTASQGENRQGWFRALVVILLAFGARLAWGSRSFSGGTIPLGPRDAPPV